MRKIYFILITSMMLLVGCDLINPNPPTPPQNTYGEKPDYNQIFYTTSDNKTVAVNFMGGEYLGFDAELVSNTYENGLGVLTFSDTITIIGVAAFQNCENLTSVTLPDGITVIGANAFYNTNLTKVTIPNKVTAIGGGAFSECENITSIMLPESLITIGERAFMCCLNLTNITIPEKVAYIGYYAFFMCEKITDINIPNSVTRIGIAPFKYCESLSSITGKFADGRCLIVNDTLLAFAPSGINEYAIPDNVTRIEYGSFTNCSNLTAVTLPQSLTSIGTHAFYGCSLHDVTIPENVTAIGDGAFSSNEYLSSFSGNFASQDRCCLIVNDTLKAFAPYDSGLQEWRKEYSIPNGIATIGANVFQICLNLTSIEIPSSVTSIRDDAFSGCFNLANVTIPNGVTSIGDRAFSWCEEITTITIPENVTELGSYVFSGCKKLESVYCKPTTPPFQMFESADEAGLFSQNAKGRKIYVPNESVDAYKSARGWSLYANDIVGYNF